ncbi:MAG: hypothetical protein QF731_08965 [Verrucomicrobiota bacterium]|nr:hypothetical protein [Verrucomicrobiota bacterium]
MSQKKQIPCKKLMVIIGIVLILLLVMLANTTESSSGGAVGSKGTPAGLEKDLPKQERIPTH